MCRRRRASLKQAISRMDVSKSKGERKISMLMRGLENRRTNTTKVDFLVHYSNEVSNTYFYARKKD